MSLANLAEPVTLVRSPTFTKFVFGPTFMGSSPDSRSSGATSGIRRGATPSTACAMAAMWAGVVPQQPPTMFSSPLRAHSPICSAMISGDSS